MHDNFFLTGGTGFLGVHILRDIIFGTDYELTLIVRGKDHDDACGRVYSKLKYYFGEEKY